MNDEYLNENFENSIEYISNDTLDKSFDTYTVIQNTYYVVSALSFLVFVFFMYRYLKAVFRKKG